MDYGKHPDDRSITESAAVASRLPAGLPEPVRLALLDYAASAGTAFGRQLRSLVLFGSAAEGRMRATSDVNVLVVLEAFEREHVDAVREAARVAYAAVRLNAMYVLAAELPLAAEAFAVKFQDMLGRRVVLHGEDPLAAIRIPPDRVRQRLRQVLLNTLLRLRAAYVTMSLRDEQLAVVIAEAAAPLRSSAAAMRALDGRPTESPKAALEAVCGTLAGDWHDVLAGLSDAREDAHLAPGLGPKLLLRLIELTATLRDAVDRPGPADAGARAT